MSLFKIETCLWMHTMFVWNRDKTASLEELTINYKIWSITGLKDDQLRWYDANLSLSQSGDFIIINETLIIARSITG